MAATLAEQSYSIDLRRTQSLQLDIVTAEGDTVTLTLAQEGAAKLVDYQGAGAAGTVTAAGVSLSARGNFSYTVAGELSVEESAAIYDLLGRVDELAGRFFSGDIAGLLEQAGGLDPDMKALASFSLQLDLSRSAQVTTAYRTVQAMAPDAAAAGDLPAFIHALDAARADSAGRKDVFDQLLTATLPWLQSTRAAEPSTTDDTETALLRLLSALEGTAVETPAEATAADTTATG